MFSYFFDGLKPPDTDGYAAMGLIIYTAFLLSGFRSLNQFGMMTKATQNWGNHWVLWPQRITNIEEWNAGMLWPHIFVVLQ